ncbi:MAG: hypothetical protein GXO39_00580 [Thermotogae bacterium]|nr:hypothetical protein [Thermotogota bacterium]
MGGLDLLFLLIFLMSLQPVIQRKMLQNARLNKIREIERKRGSRVITLIHRQETVGFFGLPISRFIDIEDSEAILRAIHMTDDNVPIDLIIHTPGGLVLAAGQIARALKRHKAKTTVIVPHYAMSGGTLIALAADEILMNPDAVLGPVDPQLGFANSVVPAASVLKVVESKPPDKVEDRTLILADVSRKAIKQMESFVLSLLKDKMEEERARKVAKDLTSGKWTHDYPLTVEDLTSMGIKVSLDVPKEVYELMELYRAEQGALRRPSVEFVPTYHGLQKGESG